MQEQPNKVGSEDDRRTQRAVILHLLCADHYESWSTRELESELATIEVSAIEAALESLEAVGVVQSQDGHVRAGEVAKRLEALDLIAL